MKFIFILIMTLALTTLAQTSKEQLEVTFSYNFARNITWPNEARFNSFNIVLVGGNKLLSDNFKTLAKSAKLKGVSINFKQVNTINNLPPSQLIFVAEDKHDLLPQLFEKVEGKPTLLVTYGYENKRLVMINLIEKEKSLVFEINKANIINNSLEVKPDLILFGGTEIDVARLYRKGQKSLSTLERKLRVQEAQLDTLKNSITKSEALIKLRESQLKEQKLNIEEQQKEISSQSDKIGKQQQELLSQDTNLKKLQVEISTSRQELEEKTKKNNELINSQKKLNTEITLSQKTITKQSDQIISQQKLLAEKIRERDKLINEIQVKVSSLADLKGKFDVTKGEVKKKELQINDIRNNISSSMEVLNQQKDKINAQNSILKKQGKTIATQNNVLQLLWFVVILVSLLIITTTRAYFNKKKANSELQQREIALNQALNKLEVTQVQLIDAKNDALSASRSKSEFLANMSHEIRTPMNAIIGFSDLLKRRVSKKEDKKFVQSIESSGRSLLRLINDILDLSKVEAGKIELEYSGVNTKPLFKEMKTIFANKVSSKNLDFIIDVDSALPNALILDETRVRQILFNLIGNAIKFTDSGYIKLKANKEYSPLDNHINLKLTVEDSGIGIPDDQKKKIFGAFEQQSGQSNAKYGGTGLGLAISKKLVELMGGSIFINDTKDGGACFTVSIPDVAISHEVKVKAKTDNIWQNLKFKKAKVLVADDVDVNRELILNYLEGQDIELIQAQNGKQAIDLAKEIKPDIILMDMKMPEVDGYEASETIRTNPTTANIPIIAITASVMKKSEQEVLKHCDAYIGKPVSQSQLFNEMLNFIPAETCSEKIEVSEKVSFNLSEKLLEELKPLLANIKKGLSTDNINDIINVLKAHTEDQPAQELAQELDSQMKAFDLESIHLTLRRSTT
ncbi:MAG: YfiR/HmsC family protein [Lentisphaeraceae bacterium]|nr:YfiR/HmsC family protein [Lentisphaeraceae bacterium]